MTFNRHVNAGVGHQHLADVVQLRNRLRTQFVLVGVEVNVFERHAGAGRINVINVKILRERRRIVRRHRHGKLLRFDVFAILAHGHLVGAARKHSYLVRAIGLADVTEAQSRFVGLRTAKHQLHARNHGGAVSRREHLAHDGRVLDVVDGVKIFLAVAPNAVAAQVSV